MTELLKRLDRLFLKLDHMAILVEQSLADAVYSLASGNKNDTDVVLDADEVIDHREVEIERECIRLLALYQPAAIDLRRICFVIKANNDLERIADLAVSLARMARILYNEEVTVASFAGYHKLMTLVTDALHQTVRLFSNQQNNGNGEKQETTNLSLARTIVANDSLVVDESFRQYLEEILGQKDMLHDKMNALYALTSIGRSLERIGDLCTNIAEDAIFLLTGEIVRHSK